MLQNINDNIIQSKTIDFLRFPLSIGVILIHTTIIKETENILPNTFPIYESITYLFIEILAQIAVPLFFLISGFLFFIKVDKFTFDVYLTKIKKRIHSLLIPYMFWNAIFILCYFLGQLFLKDYLLGQRKPFLDYSIQEWILSFWNFDGIKYDLPINGPMWFIRDLIVVVILSPLIYSVLKYLRHYSIIFLGFFWFLNIWFHIPGFSITALFFFSTGAYLGLYKKNLIAITRPLMKPCFISYIIFVSINFIFRDYEWISYIKKINILIGIILAISLSAYYIQTKGIEINKKLSSSTFFIFAFHIIPITIFSRILRSISHSDWELTLSYFMCAIITTAVSLSAYIILNRYLPRITSYITGGRT